MTLLYIVLVLLLGFLIGTNVESWRSNKEFINMEMQLEQLKSDNKQLEVENAILKKRTYVRIKKEDGSV